MSLSRRRRAISTLVIVPCGQGKVWDRDPLRGPTYAADAYTGAPFKVNKKYALYFGEVWIVLSAKYGFIKPDFLIPSSYNVTFKRKATNPVSVPVLRSQMKEQRLDDFDTVIGLGGKEYRLAVEEAFEGTSVDLDFPFSGLPIGKAMQAAKRAVAAG